MHTFKLVHDTNELDFITVATNGLFLQTWSPQIAQYKNISLGGSEISEGNIPVFAQYNTVEEEIKFSVIGTSKSQAATNLQAVISYLVAAINFWIGVSNKPVYLKVQEEGISNPRYALLYSGNAAELINTLGGGFDNGVIVDGQAYNSGLVDITMRLTRDHWLKSIPGESVAVTASNSQYWDFTKGWVRASLGSVPSLPAPSPGKSYRVLAFDQSRVIMADTGSSSGTYVSTNKGQAWAASTGMSGVQVIDMIRLSNGNIIAGCSIGGLGIARSTNNGASFTQISSTNGLGVLCELLNGDILIAENGEVFYRSQDGGVNWSLLSDLDATGYVVYGLAVSQQTGTVIAHLGRGTISHLYRSIDNGSTWQQVATVSPLGTVNFEKNLICGSDGSFYALAEIGWLYKSSDDGLTWDKIFSLDTIGIGISHRALFESSNGWLYWIIDTFEDAFHIYASTDGGSNWFLDFTNTFSPGELFEPINMAETDNGDLFISGRLISGTAGGFFYHFRDGDTLGTSSGDELTVINDQWDGQLTHIFINDGGSFSNNLFPISSSFTMLPTVPVPGDSILFGVQYNPGTYKSRHFPSSLRFHITSPAFSTISYTIAWEYWTMAGAWATLVVQDGTNAGAGAFSKIGYNTINFKMPEGANGPGTVGVNGVDAYWIRARVSAISGSLTPPVQGNSDILVINNAYVEIEADQIGGELPALARIKIHNLSDKDGRSGSGPDLWTNRILCGLRTKSRGENFSLFLHTYNGDNRPYPQGVQMSVSSQTTGQTYSALSTDSPSYTGNLAIFDPSGVLAMTTQVTLSLDAAIANDYKGKFRCFLVGKRTGGSQTDITVQIQIATGSGNVLATTRTKQFRGTTRFEVLDFGQITLPAGPFAYNELSDVTEIRIQASAASSLADAEFHTLVLVPVDEWAIDAIDYSNVDNSIIGLNDSVAKYLDINSIPGLSKSKLRSLVKQSGGNDYITSVYVPIASGPAILQNGLDQRLWFFSMKTEATGNDPVWIADPMTCHAIQIYKVERFLTLGN